MTRYLLIAALLVVGVVAYLVVMWWRDGTSC